MGAWTHGQYRSRRRRPQGRQPDMGRPVQHLLLDRPGDANRRRDHDADPPLRRPAGAWGLSAIRTRDLPRAWVGLKIEANRVRGDSPRTHQLSNLPRQPLTPTLQERASLVSTPRKAGRGRSTHRFNPPGSAALRARKSPGRCWGLVTVGDSDQIRSDQYRATPPGPYQLKR